MENIRVVFMGTPDFSVPVLEALLDNYNVVGVVTQPDKEVGRKKELTPSPIKKVALDNNIKVLQQEKIRKEYENIFDLKPDIIITCAYGQIIPKELLDYPKYGCINVHASLLPKNRGGAPIHRAIINGEDKTGITIMYMAEGMDDGDIIRQEEIDILSDDNVGSLHDKLSRLGAELLIKTLPDILAGNIIRTKQNNDEATFSYIIKKEDEYVDFCDTTKNVYNKIRGLYPFPVGYTILDFKIIKLCESRIGNKLPTIPGEIIEVLNDGIGISTQDGEIILTKIKPEGKKEMYVKDYLNGLDKNNLIGKKVGRL